MDMLTDESEREPANGRSSNDRGEGEISVSHKLLLAAAFLGNETIVNFDQIYIVPVLQTLGMPLKFVFLSVLLSGFISLVLIPVLGWMSDRGLNPIRRKAGLVLLSAGLMMTGCLSLIVANLLHLHSPHSHVMNPRLGDVDGTMNTSPPDGSVNMSLPDGTTYTSLSSSSTVRLATFDENATVQNRLRSSFGSVMAHPFEKKTQGSSLTSENNKVPSNDKIFAKRRGTSETSSYRTSNHSDSKLGTTGNIFDLDHVPFKAGLGALGFALAETGYDCMVCFAKSWLLTCTSRSEHVSVLGMGTVAASAGGIVTAILSNVAVQGHTSQGKPLQGAALATQVILQSGLNIVFVIVTTISTLMTGRRLLNSLHNAKPTTDSDSNNQQMAEEDVSQLSEILNTARLRKYSEYNLQTCCVTMDVQKETVRLQRAVITSYQSNQDTVTPLGLSTALNKDATREDIDITDSPQEIQHRNLSSKLRENKPRWFKWNVTVICFSAFFLAAAILLFSINISDYVGKAIYRGHPAGAGKVSDVGVDQYQAGLHFTAMGFIVYYVVYLVFSVLHSRVLTLLGYKMEMLLVQAVTGVSLVMLIVTACSEAFLWVVVVASIQRATFHVIPFALMNEIMQTEVDLEYHQEKQEQTQYQQETQNELQQQLLQQEHQHQASSSSGKRTGVAMSLVMATCPLTYCLIFPWLGQVVQVTGLVALPLWLSVICAGLSALFFVLVRH